jgi:hypothetical protein
VGLITGLLTFPLAPVRGTIALAQVLLEEAEKQLDDPENIRKELEHVASLREQGVLDEAEAASWENALIERLMQRSSGDSRASGGWSA